jgi:type II secretory pathway pseudopilin PulG
MKVSLNNPAASAANHRGSRSLLARFVGLLAPRRRSARRCGGFTLEEVVVSMGISALTIGGVATGYATTTKRAEWSTYSAAAQSAALLQVEQVRAAKWDPLALPATDELVSANFPVTTVKLDLPGASGTVAYVTNRTTITSLSMDPPLKLVRVDSTWSFNSRGPFTNTVTTYRSP